MSSIPQIFTPENLALDPGVDQLRPIAKISLGYKPLTGQTVTVVNILGAVINGVDVLKHFDSVISPTALNPTMVTLGRQLWRGNYKIGIAQRVEHVHPGGTSRFSTGAIYDAGASWNLSLPMSARVYRPYGIGFPTAFDYFRNGMDPIWSRHEDATALAQVVSAIRQMGECETINMIGTRNTSWVQLVEPLDRFDGPIVNVDGAVSDPVPYFDIEALYDLPSNSRGYLWGVDYIINSKGRVVFLCADAPGRVPGAAILSDIGFPDRPPASAFKRAVSFSLGETPASVFVEDPNAKITGFDWFITPALTPDSSGVYPPGGDTNAIGKVLAFVQKTGESFVIYDSALNSAVFNGTVLFRAPVTFTSAEAIRFYRVTATGATASVDVTVWLNRRATLVGPHSHIANGRLNYFWNAAVGEGKSASLQDKLIVMAGMKTRTEKSIGSFATYVEALLGCPLSPFDGAYVTELRQPDPRGYVPGQIGIYGALQEFDISLDLSVKLGDKVSLLQSLTKPTDGVSIVDIYSDPNFMQFSPDGAPPVDDSSALAYVRSKIVGPVRLPVDFVAQYPTGTPVFLAAEILKSKSFRVDLGVYSSRRFFLDPGLQQRIFSAIDAVKPSGTDYWLRLSDGTAIVKSPSVSRSIDVSSNLDLPTDYAQRIFNDEAFATGQYYNFYVSMLPGSVPRVGDQYVLNLFDTSAKSSIQTLSLADFNGHPIFPMDAIYERWATDINAMVPASTFVIASVFDHSLKIEVKPAAGSLEQVRYTTPYTAYAQQTSGSGSVAFAPSTPMAIAPTDISMVFRSLAQAIGTMNGYRELTITSGTSYLNLADFGAGIYDSTVVALANPSTTPYGADVAPAFGAGARVGRLRLEGCAYSDGFADGSITIGYSVAGGFIPGSGFSLTLTISHSNPAVLAVPIVLSRPIQATDSSTDSVFAGMAKEIMTNPTLIQYFTADYPTALAPAKLVILPVNPDDPVLSGFTFALNASGGAPTLYIANSAGSTTAAGPISKPITPSAPPALTVSFTCTGFPVRTATANIYSKRASGAGNFFVFEIPAETVAATATTITANITVGSGAYGTINRPVSIQNMRVIVNDYPEYSRDDNFPVLWDAFKVQPFPTTFTDLTPGNPAIAVPNPVPDLYYRKNEIYVDTTPRMISPSQTTLLSAADDYAYIPIHLGAAGASRAVKQNLVSIDFLTDSSILFRDNLNGTFTELILGTDYTEASPNIATLVGGNQTARIVGYVKSTDYSYYYEGPRAPSRTVVRRLASAAGARALYNEPTGGPNDFRQANKVPAPYGIPEYLASKIKDNPAFKLDTEVIGIVNTGFSIKRVR